MKARDEWPHTTAGSICDLGETVAIEVFDDDMEPGHVQLYISDRVKRWPARTVSDAQPHRSDVLSSWAGRGELIDHRADQSSPLILLTGSESAQ